MRMRAQRLWPRTWWLRGAVIGTGLGATLVLAIVALSSITSWDGVCCPNGAQSERDTIQTAIDSYLAEEALAALPPDVVPTTSRNEFTAGPGRLDLTVYLRDATTIYFYCFDRAGRITAQHDGPEECP
ncbi:MAG: hypothetical protein IH956_04245 [Chloroflexi bacterium]|nr:hypothetical protein [Chloroflexota bacterium]